MTDQDFSVRIKGIMSVSKRRIGSCDDFARDMNESNVGGNTMKLTGIHIKNFKAIDENRQHRKCIDSGRTE